MIEEKFWEWIYEIHKHALIICPDYGTHQFKDRIEFMRRQWKKNEDLKKDD